MKFTDHLIDPKYKDYDWILKYVKAAWQEYSRISSDWQGFYSTNCDFEEVKLYAQGKQSNLKYRKMLKVDEGGSANHLSLDWEPLKFFARMRQKALSRIGRMEFDVSANPLDPQLDEEIAKHFSEIAAKIKISEVLKDASKDIPELKGTAELFETDSSEPSDLEELEIYKQYGYKHRLSMEFEQLISLILYKNSWSSIRKEVEKDLFDYGVAITKDDIDLNNEVKLRRVKPSEFFCNYCEDESFSDLEYCGEVRLVTLTQLKAMSGDQIPVDRYDEIKTQVAEKYGNPRYSSANYNSLDLKCKIIDIEFASINMRNYQRSNKNGRTLVSRAKFGRRGSNVGKEYVQDATRVWYKAKWIEGTDIMFDFGLAKNMKVKRSDIRNAKSSYHVRATSKEGMSFMSHTRSAISLVDSIQIAWLKVQQSISESRPAGFALDLDAIESISFGQGGADLTPEDVIDMYVQRGILVYRSRDLSMDGAMSGPPLSELPANVSNSLVQFYDIFQRNMMLLEAMLGYNQVTSGGNTARMNKDAITSAEVSTDDSLADVGVTLRDLMAATFDGIATRGTVVLSKKDIEGYVPAIGSNTMEFIRATKELSHYDFAIDLNAVPTSAEKNQLVAIATAKSQEGSLDFTDVLMIKNTRNLKMAEMLLTHRISKRKKQRMEESMMLQQQNAQVQIQSTQASEQAKQQTMSMEMEGKIMLLREEYRLKAELEMMERETKLLVEQERNKGKVEVAVVTADSNEEMAFNSSQQQLTTSNNQGV